MEYDIPDTMKCIVTTGDGKFELKRAPVPKPQPDEILVKVEACAQNHTDWKSVILHQKAGNIMGSDYAGVVVSIGSNVPPGMRSIGERISGIVHGNVFPNGAFAEYLITNPGLVIALPDDLSFEMAAQLGVSCYATCQALYQTLGLPTPLAPTKKRMDILIWSGSSSTGHYAVQFARLAGLRVISTSSPRNYDLVRSLGAAEVYDYEDSKTPKKIYVETSGDLRLAVDCISSGRTPAQVSGCLSKEGGTIATMLPYAARKKGVDSKPVVLYSIWGKTVEIPMPSEGNIEHYYNGVEYGKMISYMLSKKMLKLGAIKIFPKGLASVQEGIAYMTKGKICAEKIVYRICDTPDV